MRLSIIIPAKNAERTIAECIYRVFCNKSTEIECIVIVNDSSDKTYEICKRLTAKYQNLRVLKTDTAGVSSARNIGLIHAHGELVGFCDADDLFEKGALDGILNDFSIYDADMIITGFYRAERKGNMLIKRGEAICGTPRILSSKAAQLHILSDRKVLGSVCNKFYKRKTIFGIDFDTSLTHCEDMLFNMRILKCKGLKIILSDRITYNYIFDRNSTTNRSESLFDEQGRLKYFDALAKIEKLYLKDDRIKLELAAVKTMLGIDNFEHCHGDRIKQAQLRGVIARGFPAEIATAYERRLRTNARYLCLGLAILLGIKR